MLIQKFEAIEKKKKPLYLYYSLYTALSSVVPSAIYSVLKVHASDKLYI